MIILRKTYSSKKGFTLVEVIVVLVILSVLAAMVVPGLTGYVKRSKEEAQQTRAMLALNAMQTVMNNMCLKKLDPSGSSGSIVDWSADSATDKYKEYGESVIESMGLTREGEPYILILGCGDSTVYAKEPAKRYSVYYIAYLQDENSEAWYYLDGEWLKKNPLASGSMTATVSGEQIELQLYVISNRSSGDAIACLKEHSQA